MAGSILVRPQLCEPGSALHGVALGLELGLLRFPFLSLPTGRCSSPVAGWPGTGLGGRMVSTAVEARARWVSVPGLAAVARWGQGADEALGAMVERVESVRPLCRFLPPRQPLSTEQASSEFAGSRFPPRSPTPQGVGGGPPRRVQERWLGAGRLLLALDNEEDLLSTLPALWEPDGGVNKPCNLQVGAIVS